MPRTRYLHADFFVDDTVGYLPPIARLALAGLWVHADRSGRLQDRPVRLKVVILPYDACDMDAILGTLVAAGVIERYEVGGERCIQVIGWEHIQRPHVNEKPSEIPVKIEDSVQGSKSLRSVRKKSVGLGKQSALTLTSVLTPSPSARTHCS